MRWTFVAHLCLSALMLCSAANVYGQERSDGQAGTQVVVNEESLLKAVLDEDEVAVETLLKAGLSPNLKYFDAGMDEEITVLTKASYNGNAKIVKALIAAGANVNERGPYGENALWEATISGNLEIVKALLEAGSEVNIETYRTGYTPLLSAAEANEADVVKALLDAGAEVNVRVRVPDRDDSGSTPLTWAVENHNCEMAKRLIEAGANVNAEKTNGKTSLMIALANEDEEIIELLKSSGALK